MEFTTWFRNWLARHPLKEPAGSDRVHYTAEVMAKVRALHPVPVPSRERRWTPQVVFGWPRLALVGMSLAAVMLVVVTRAQRVPQLATQIDRDVQLLAVFDEPVLLSAERGEDLEALAQDLEDTDDLIVLAESTPSDEQWLEETLQVLDQFEEDLPSEATDETSDDMLNELEQLDDTEFSASS